MTDHLFTTTEIVCQQCRKRKLERIGNLLTCPCGHYKLSERLRMPVRIDDSIIVYLKPEAFERKVNY